MRVLLDNCVPWRLGRELPGHKVSSLIKLGWTELTDGDVLDKMADDFDVLVTMDKNLRFQQNMQERSVTVLILRSPTNNLATLRLIVPALLKALDNLVPGVAREIRVDD